MGGKGAEHCQVTSENYNDNYNDDQVVYRYDEVTSR